MKKILFTLAAVSLASFGFAQDFGFGDGDFGGGDFGGGDGFGGGFEASSEPSVTISGEVGTSARAWIGTTTDLKKAKQEGALTDKQTEYYNAGVYNLYDTKGYDKFYDVSKSDVEGNVYANIELNYLGDYTDANVKLKLDSGSISDYPEDVIDEASAGGSFKEGRIQFRAGKMKEVWGKGDKVHVLDNFNANDYTDFIFPDYIDRRIGEIMFKTTFNLSWDYNLKLEGIYAPMMTADRFASDGKLVPYAQTNLTNTVKKILVAQNSANLVTTLGLTTENDGSHKVDTNKTVDTDTLVTGLMNLSNFSQDDLYEDNVKSLKYGQAGARLTGTIDGIDWGTSYYYGHYKQPSANLENLIKMNYYTAAAKAYAAEGATTQATTQATAAATEASNILAKDIGEIVPLNYDQVQVFGLEAAFVLWKLNTRWEAAYNLTEDIAGDNPWIKNNSVAWVAGFDIDLPIHNLNLNVQETGSYILHNDKVKDMDRGITIGGNTVSWKTIGTNYDVDYNSDDKYTRNKLIVLLSDKWLNEKLTTEVQGIWGIEFKEFMVAPKIEYNISEGLTFGLRGVYLYSNNENGEFYNFTKDSLHHDKAFVELTAKYQF